MSDLYSDALAVVAAAPSGAPVFGAYTGAPDDVGYLREWVISHAAVFYGVNEEVFDTATVLSTTLLRDYVHRAIWQQEDAPDINEIAQTDPSYVSADVGRMFRYAAQGLCGDMSFQLWNVFIALGFDANDVHTIDGDLGGWEDSHASTQVYIPELGRYVVQDSTFNYAILNATGELLSFTEARDLIALGEIPNLVGAVNYRWASEDLIESPQLNDDLSSYILDHYFDVVSGWRDETGVRSEIFSVYPNAGSAHDPASDQGGTFATAIDAIAVLTALLADGLGWSAIAAGLRADGRYVSGFISNGEDRVEWLTVRLADGDYISIRLMDRYVIAGALDELLARAMVGPLDGGLVLSSLPELLSWSGSQVSGSQSVRPAPVDHFATAGSLDLSGTTGRDRMFGDANANVLDGRAGDDYLVGKAGDDTYIVDSVRDVVVEAVGGGRDVVRSSVSYTLAASAEVEELRAFDPASTVSLNLTGNVFSNSLYGNAGANQLDGGGGADQMRGLAGDDTYFVDDSDDEVFEVAGEGFDTVITNVSYTLAAGAAVEVLRTFGSATTQIVNLTGNEFDQRLEGNSAANRLDGGAGADSMWGYGGDDTYVVDSSGDQVFEAVGDGYDTVYASASFTLQAGSAVERIEATGTAAIDLTANEFENVLIGNSANNTLNGGGGADTLSGGDGNDTYLVDDQGDQVIELDGEGFDTVITNVSYILAAGASVESLRTYGSATTQAINLIGNELGQRIEGNNGNNIIDGRGGADAMWGFAGDDTYFVDDAGDQVIEAADEGFDTAITSVSYILAAGVAVEVLRTVDSAATQSLDLTGNAFAQRLEGNAGANIIDGRGGSDVMAGFGGDDTYFVDDAGDQVIEAVDEGFDTVITNVSYTLAAGVSVETLRTYGSSTTQALNLTGNEFAQRLEGNGGNNVLDGGAGADMMWGFGGDDTFIIDDARDQVIETVGNGFDTAITSVSYVLSAGSAVEVLRTNGSVATQALNLTGNEFAQTLEGNAGDNVLNGGGGADVMRGFGGNDTFFIDDAGDEVIEGPDEGFDTVITNVSYTLATGVSVEVLRTYGSSTTQAVNLTGNEFGQRIEGNGGNNIIDGGAGADVMWGYGGDDVFYVDDVGDQVVEFVDQGFDTVYASVNFVLRPGSAVELIYARPGGAIDLTGNEFANTLVGNDSDNVLNGGGGADTLRGYDGNDTYFVDNIDDVVMEVAGEGFDTLITNVSYTLAAGVSVEVLRTYGSATTQAVNLTGNEFAQRLEGNGGNNVLDGGAGADVMWGYGGDDIFLVDNAGDQVVELADQGFDTVSSSVNFALTRGSSVEVLQAVDVSATTAIALAGNELANTLKGNAGNNQLDGGGGVDILYGYGGNDTYLVDNAADQVFEAADEGFDTLVTNVDYTLAAGVSVEVMRTYGSATTQATNLTGNELANRLEGNAGDNILNGGGGDDVFWGYGGSDRIDGGEGQDLVVLRGERSDYQIVAGAGGFEIIDSVQGRDGKISITSIEQLLFLASGVYENLLVGPATQVQESFDKALVPELSFQVAIVAGAGPDTGHGQSVLYDPHDVVIDFLLTPPLTHDF